MASRLVYSRPEHAAFTLGDGPPDMLLIHGFPGTPAEMRPLARAMHAAGHTVHVPLLPGFGANIHRLSITRRADWIDAAQAAWDTIRRGCLETGRIPVLGGYSMGGAIALHVAATAPPGRLLLIAPFWRLPWWVGMVLPLGKHLIRAIAPFTPNSLADPATRAELGRLLPEANLEDPVTREFIRREMRLPTAAIDEVRQLGEDAYEMAPAVRAQTLIVQGSADRVVRPADTRRLAARLPGPVTYREVAGDHAMLVNAADGDERVRLAVSFIDS